LVVPVLPLVLPPMPLLPLAPLLELPGRGAGCAGVVGLVVELPTEPLGVLEEPAPALARSSRRHFSCAAPTMPMHLAGIGPEAPALDEPLPMLEPPEVVLPELPPAAAPLPTLEPDEAPVEPEGPELEPELCARVAVESARSAAAVAAVSVFNIMSDLLEIDGWTAAALHAKCVPGGAARVHSANAL
jgi:hypothetical protein